MTRALHNPMSIIGGLVPAAKVAKPSIPSAEDAAAAEDKSAEEARRKAVAEQQSKSGRAKSLLTPTSDFSTLGTRKRTLGS